MSELHNQHWNNPDIGQAECECCCGWALDAEQDRKRIAALEQENAKLRWTLITETNLPKTGDEVWRRDGNVLAVFDAISIRDQKTWEALGYLYFRPINDPLPHHVPFSRALLEGK